MIRTDFSRSFLRMGYDVSEVLTFLGDVERTLTGQETDPEKVVTAQKALDVEFSAKLRGFNDEEVDAEIDRLIEMLRQLTGRFQIDIGRSAVLFQILEPHTAKASIGCRFFLGYCQIRQVVISVLAICNFHCVTVLS